MYILWLRPWQTSFSRHLLCYLLSLSCDGRFVVFLVWVTSKLCHTGPLGSGGSLEVDATSRGRVPILSCATCFRERQETCLWRNWPHNHERPSRLSQACILFPDDHIFVQTSRTTPMHFRQSEVWSSTCRREQPVSSSRKTGENWWYSNDLKKTLMLCLADTTRSWRLWTQATKQFWLSEPTSPSLLILI